MVSPAGNQKSANRSVSRSRLTVLYHSIRLMFLFLLFVMPTTIFAQDSDIQVELVARTSDDEVIIHVRLPQGQTVDEAVLSQGDNSILLTADTESLPLTRFILIDTSSATINFEDILKMNIDRFWRTGDHLTSLTFYNQDVMFYEPANDSEINNNRLDNYTNEGVVACHGDALARLNTLTRDYDRSWRILLVTAGNFAEQEDCGIQDLPVPPSWIDVLALADPVDARLENLTTDGQGQLYTSLLPTTGNEITRILSEWGKSTYALQGDIPDGWDMAMPFELDIRLADGTDDRIPLEFGMYTVPTPTPLPTASPLPTDTDVPVTATLLPTETALAVVADATAVPTVTPDDADTSPQDSSGVAILLIIGAFLFVMGAVVLALALSRVRRAPVEKEPAQSPGFYETLHLIENEDEGHVSATRVRERDIVSREEDAQTQIASLDDTQLADDDIADDINDHDELLMTRALTDERFKNMIEQSMEADEIAGWLRLVVDGEGEDRDFELTQRGAVIGRSQDCDIQITGDRAISRQHARLDVRSNGQVTVSRLSAINPVVVGGVQVSNRHPLAPNDVIHLSDETRLIFVARGEEHSDTEIQGE